MLSVLIPVYNVDVRVLVDELLSQASTVSEACEIICVDDASKPQIQRLNRSLRAKTGCHYEELERNIGRSRIRNLLASRASQPFLLFLDCDAHISNNDFLASYFRQLSPERVLVGGRRYSAAPPPRRYRLHWKYGRQREMRSRAQFQSNNFAIAKKLFEEIRFDEAVEGYGHEDTLFGHQLRAAAIPVVAIANPVEHASLEDVDDFLAKQREAARNLVRIRARYPEVMTRLAVLAASVRRWRLSPVLTGLADLWIPTLGRMLRGPMPSLALLDLYKLIHYLQAESMK